MAQQLDIAETMVRVCGLRPGQRLVVGVSGGPDSLGLMHRIVALRERQGWSVHIAHLNHLLRGAEAAAEAAFVAALAAELGVGATIGERDVAALAQSYSVGLPAAARAARYAFLAEVAFKEKADAVVVAHQAEDQAETVLLHLVRGAGPSGLSGMAPRLEWAEWRHTAGRSERVGPALVRPLLYTTREEIEAYCAEHGLEPRRDPTNDATEYRRGKLRHQILPMLRELNPQIVEALGRTARLATQERDYMQRELADAWPELIVAEAGAIHVAKARWEALHPALQRLALRDIVAELRPEREALSATQIDQALAAIGRGQVVQRLPNNLVLHVDVGGWTIGMATNTHPATNEPQLSVEALTLDQDRPTVFPDGRWQIRLQRLPGRPEANLTRWQALLDADALVGQLQLRQRQPGDRLHPAGGVGSRKVQDIMVDLRLPRELRQHWPLLADGAGLLWIPGLVVAERAHPGNETHAYVLVTLEELSEHES